MSSRTPLNRRTFVKQSALAAVAALPLSQLLAKSAASAESVSPGASPPTAGGNTGPGAQLLWLERAVPAEPVGVTWGMPWSRGQQPKDAMFSLRARDGSARAVQSWPLAYWPDGSLKWTAHAAVLGGGSAKADEGFTLENSDTAASSASPAANPAPGGQAVPGNSIRVTESADDFVVDTGVIECRIPRRGDLLVRTLRRDGREVARDGRLVGLVQGQPEPSEGGTLTVRPFAGETRQATLEQRGPVRAVVKLEGMHRGDGGRAWLPFVVRLYFYAGSDAVRMMHSFVFDGDEQKDFIRGLGVRFSVPMHDDPLKDRHIRFAGEGDGLWAEAVRPLTGLRRDSGKAARDAQVAGRATPAPAELPETVGRRLERIPAWGDFTLSQLSADGFEIRKRTKPGFGWIPAGAGRRASGLGYVGGISGGLVFGQRDFWQRHPTQLDIRGAHSDAAEITAWLWSPDAPPMDLRFYHDEMGMDTYAEQTDAMEITYEDYEPGFGSPVGTARSNELMFWAVGATPSRERFTHLAAALRLPPVLVPLPEQMVRTGIFGGTWSLPKMDTPLRRHLEQRQKFLVDFYRNQVEQRRWYGFWDYGDVMHTYDVDRHVWRYDIGGYAWDNSELSPDLWLWLSFLRTGSAEVFRLAEAMTRHTGEVDVHHLGRFKGLGSRHNVQHWGCSAKQVRISNAAYRRIYYYLTADERVGDLLHETVESHRAYLTLLPTRKTPGKKPPLQGANGKEAFVGVGTDFGAIASAWLTEWERTGDPKQRDRLVAAMTGIAAMPHGFFSGGGMMDVETGAFQPGTSGERVSVSHLSAVFGLVEACAELVQLLDVPAFDRAWLDYCELYNAPAEEQVRRLGQALRGTSLTQAHARLTAYAAFRKKDAALGERAWKEFLGPKADIAETAPLRTVRVEGPDVLAPIDEATWISTNGASQWGLAEIELNAWVPDYAPASASTT
jgi:hypothetical protein